MGSQGGLSDWTERMRAALGQVETDVILAMLDDQWLIESADARALEDFATIMLNDQADYILLNTGTTRSKGEFELDSRLFILADNSRYRTVMQASFWRVGIFLDLLQDGETAWQFERGSALRSRGSDRFLAVKKNACLRYVERNIADYSIGNPVVRGKWTASAKLYAEREGLKLDFSRHPGESP